MATGVLPVFVGRATRGVEFFEHAEKTYETELLLGVATDTEDTTGTVLTRREVSVTQEQLTEVLERFRGEIMQIPPMYSALKVNGQKLCDLARKGRQVERQPRPVTIHELTLLSREGDTLRLRVRCSKGTYIRVLAEEIGAVLGVPATLSALRRTQAGVFSLEQCHTLPEILAAAECGELAANDWVLPIETVFAPLPLPLPLSFWPQPAIRPSTRTRDNTIATTFFMYIPSR